MQLGIIIQGEVDQRNTKPYDITYMWNLKYDTNDSYETESGTLKLD